MQYSYIEKCLVWHQWKWEIIQYKDHL